MPPALQNVTLEAFASMLREPHLRAVLGVTMPQQVAEEILASPGVTRYQYEMWRAQAPSAPHMATSAATRAPAPNQPAPSKISFSSAIRGLVWSAAGVAAVVVAMVLAVVAYQSGADDIGVDVTVGIGYFAGIVASVVGVIYSARALAEASRSTIRGRTAVIVMGIIGVIGGVWLAAAWVIGWSAI